MDDTYIKAIEKSKDEPLSLSCYVDDSLIFWPGTLESFMEFKDEINKIWPTLNFTLELITPESEGLTFLDLKIKRDNNNKIVYIFHQKPTHSGHYLHYTSHCSMSTKINLIKNEASRITNNCLNKEDTWPFLEKLKSDLISSGYPEHMVNTYILEGTKKHNKSGNKKEFDFIYRLPYVNEGFTRIMKNIIKKSEINARIVVTPGKSIKSAIKKNRSKFCTSNNCILCTNKMPCKTTHYVYQFTCNHCTDKSTNNNNNNNNKKPVTYIGASRRVMVKRLKQHEASVRRFNNRTTLGEHMISHHSHLNKSNNNHPPKVNFNNLFHHFTPKIIDRGTDTLNLFIKEGIHIKSSKPHINNMSTNGYV